MSQAVIVGAGHAGGRAALALRAAGFEGRIALIGAEPHRPYERPPLSKELLAGAIPPEKTSLKSAEAYEESGIDLMLGCEVEEIDRSAGRVRLASRQTLAYDQLLLTTGARPRRLAVEGADCRHVFYLRDLADAAALAARLKPGVKVAVVGAGLIGLEVAATARGLGCEVTVLEAADAPLGRVMAPEVAAWFTDQHRAHGVEIITGACVSLIEEHPSSARLQLADAREIVAEVVVVGIGVIPNDELARDAGLDVADGVIVDEFGRTSDGAIFAAGDVARAYHPLLGRRLRLETWRNAQDQSVAVAKVMAGGDEPYADVSWSWTDQYGFNMQMAGVALEWDELVWRGSPADPRFTVFYMRAGRVVAANALNNARDIRFASALIKAGAAVDAAALADPGVPLAGLAA